jgi:hypothetical protein
MIREKINGIMKETEGQNPIRRFFIIGWRIARAGLTRFLSFKWLIGGVKKILRLVRKGALWLATRCFFPLVYPLNLLLSRIYTHKAYPHSVLHISYMVHIPYYMTRILRKQGMKADYLAAGGYSPWWDKYDFHFPKKWPPLPWNEFLFFWKVVARYEVIHSHFGIMLSSNGWELPFLKRMGRRIVVHYRGCEARDPDLNMRLHPQVNICQECDYNRTGCMDGKQRVALAQKFGDLFLVTTPDMQDFMPQAIHFTFFTPEIEYEKYRADDHVYARGDELKIVHVTNHPGIEGTRHIQEAIDHLRAKGFRINFVFLRGVTPERALEEYREADLSVGKLKMGYYANAQIESMFLGVPAVTSIRPEFITPELEASGMILTDIDHLEETLEHYLTHPEELALKRAIARSSILALHDNDRLAKRLIDLYHGGSAHAA